MYHRFMAKKKIGPWTRLNSKTVYDNNWISVNHEEVLNPNGGEGIYGKIHFKNLAIGIVPIDDKGFTFLVGQHRYPLDVYSWEIPEGGGPIGIDPIESAKRELLEETGLVANKWEKLIDLHLSNSVSDEVAHIVVATELEKHQAQPEETEQLEIKHIHILDAISLLHEGKITDAMSVAALLKTEKLIRDEKLII